MEQRRGGQFGARHVGFMLRGIAWSTGALTMVMTAGSCNAWGPYPVDESTDHGTDSTDGPELSACPSDTHRCFELPEGWQGPVALAERDRDKRGVGCSGNYSEMFRHRLFGELSAPDAKCRCSCGTDPIPPVCELTIERNCDDPDTTWTVQEGCTETGPLKYSEGSAEFFNFMVDMVEPGRCESAAKTHVEPLAWAAEAGLCSFTGDSFDAECPNAASCVPLPSSALGERMCVYREGDHACPEPFAATKPWFLDEIDQVPDDRGCTECACTWSGGVCGGRLKAYSDAYCEADDWAAWPVDSCLAWVPPGQLHSVSYSRSVEDPGTCAPSGGVSTGAAVPQSPLTVCCL